MASAKECSAPVKLHMRSVAYLADKSLLISIGKIAATVRKGLLKLLHKSIIHQLSFTLDLEEAILVSPRHPLHNLIQKLGQDLTFSFVHVRDQKMDDGC